MRRAPSSAATRPARATSSRTAASPTCASSASPPRTGSCSRTSGRSGCGSPRAGRSSTPRSARAAATRTRSSGCAPCSTRCSTGCPLGRTEMSHATRGPRQRRRDRRRIRLARVANAAPHRPLPRPPRAARGADAEARRKALEFARGSTASRPRSTSPPRGHDRGGAPAIAALDEATPRSSAPRRTRLRAGSPTRPCSPGTDRHGHYGASSGLPTGARREPGAGEPRAHGRGYARPRCGVRGRERRPVHRYRSVCRFPRTTAPGDHLPGLDLPDARARLVGRPGRRRDFE